jgi:hypothetical protein
MTPDVIFATPETPCANWRLMLDNRVSALPIIEDSRVVGIVSDGDLLRRAETGTEPHPARWLELATSTDRLATDYTRSYGRGAAIARMPALSGWAPDFTKRWPLAVRVEVLGMQ